MHYINKSLQQIVRLRTMTLKPIILAILITCVANSFAETFKCVDTNGKVVYSNTHCPDNTRLEKSVNSSSIISRPASLPNLNIQSASNQVIGESTSNISVTPIWASAGTALNCQAGSYLSIDNRGNKICKNLSTSSLPESRYFSAPFSGLTPTDTDTQEKIDELQLQQEQLKRDQERAQEAADQAKQEAEKQAIEVANVAETEAANLHDQMLRSEVRAKNNSYLIGILLLTCGFIIYVIKKNKSEATMNEHQKYGIAVIVISSLLTIFVLMISGGWVNNLDFLGNLMQFLRIEFFSIETECISTGVVLVDKFRTGPCYADLIDIQTKYVVLAFMSTAAYGLTTYLGITPAFMPWKKSSIK